MINAYAVADVRAAEESTMRRLPDGELMSRASLGIARVAAARLAQRGGATVVVLVGSGDNGGDALYAAAQLAEHYEVTALLVRERAHDGGRAAAQSAGVTVVPAAEGASASSRLGDADLVIDGIFGIGGRPGLSSELEALVEAIPESAYVLAVDLPSGVDPSGVQACAATVFADETVTLGVAKPAHLLPATEPAVGRLTVIDIGIVAALTELGLTPAVQRLTPDDVATMWPRPRAEDNKYSRGVLGVVAGGEGYTGAPVLCVTAAVCAGAGMVRYVGPSAPADLIRAAVPETVFGEGRVQAWAVGSGLDAQDDSDTGREQVAAARRALDSGLPCLVDAGGLDLLDESTLPRREPTLLTPHAGELARLSRRIGGAEDVAIAPVAAAASVAALTGATVLLKGATTLVVPPPDSGLPIRSQADAPAWLATAGSGDVLAGLAGMLLSAGLSPRDAGSLAALVHGLAGHAANPGGPVRALGVAHAIPGVVASLLERS